MLLFLDFLWNIDFCQIYIRYYYQFWIKNPYTNPNKSIFHKKSKYKCNSIFDKKSGEKRWQKGQIWSKKVRFRFLFYLKKANPDEKNSDGKKFKSDVRKIKPDEKIFKPDGRKINSHAPEIIIRYWQKMYDIPTLLLKFRAWNLKGYLFWILVRTVKNWNQYWNLNQNRKK